MNKLRTYILETARTDPAFWKFAQLEARGDLDEETMLLELIKFLKTQRDNLYQTVLDLHLKGLPPIIIQGPLTSEQLVQGNKA